MQLNVRIQYSKRMKNEYVLVLVLYTCTVVCSMCVYGLITVPDYNAL